MFFFSFQIASVLQASGEGSCSYGVPSLALKLCYSLKMCAGIIQSKALREKDTEVIKHVDTFLELYKEDWSNEISSQALENLHDLQYKWCP